MFFRIFTDIQLVYKCDRKVARLNSNCITVYILNKVDKTIYSVHPFFFFSLFNLEKVPDYSLDACTESISSVFPIISEVSTFYSETTPNRPSEVCAKCH